MQANWPYVINLGNSIIGVSVLAMPFCFKKTGILLGTILLISCACLTVLSCQLLLKSATAAKKRSYEFLALHTFGKLGKLGVEFGIIGLLLGTCIAFHVIIGDLGPAILSKMLNVENDDNLRTYLMLFMSLFVALPLGLFRNLQSLSNISAISLGFYVVFISQVVFTAIPNLWTGVWMAKVEYWNAEGVFNCLPIFALAFGCQSQLFVMYDALPEPSLKRMTSISKSAIRMCTAFYLLVGYFGYVAFCDDEVSGDILMNFRPTMFSESVKMGFVISVAVSFPLIIYPCRASIYTLCCGKTQGLHDNFAGAVVIPDTAFRLITACIVMGTLVIGIFLPNIEFVLALTGATMGSMICFIFPAAMYITIMSLQQENTSTKSTAQVVLFLGVTILLASTYVTLNSQESTKDSIVKVAPLDGVLADVKHDAVIEDIEKKHIDIKDDGDDVIKDAKNDPILDAHDKQEGKVDETNIEKEKVAPLDESIRHEPPIPLAPDSKPKNTSKQELKVENKNEEKKDVKRDIEQENAKDENKDKNRLEEEKNDKAGDKNGVNEEKKTNEEEQKQLKDEAEGLLEELRMQREEQKQLIEEQKGILEDLKQHHKEVHEHKDAENDKVGDGGEEPVDQQKEPNKAAADNNDQVQINKEQDPLQPQHVQDTNQGMTPKPIHQQKDEEPKPVDGDVNAKQSVQKTAQPNTQDAQPNVIQVQPIQLQQVQVQQQQPVQVQQQQPVQLQQAVQVQPVQVQQQQPVQIQQQQVQQPIEIQQQPVQQQQQVQQQQPVQVLVVNKPSNNANPAQQAVNQQGDNTGVVQQPQLVQLVQQAQPVGQQQPILLQQVPADTGVQHQQVILVQPQQQAVLVPVQQVVVQQPQDNQQQNILPVQDPKPSVQPGAAVQNNQAGGVPEHNQDGVNDGVNQNQVIQREGVKQNEAIQKDDVNQRDDINQHAVDQNELNQKHGVDQNRQNQRNTMKQDEVIQKDGVNQRDDINQKGVDQNEWNQKHGVDQNGQNRDSMKQNEEIQKDEVNQNEVNQKDNINQNEANQGDGVHQNDVESLHGNKKDDLKNVADTKTKNSENIPEKHNIDESLKEKNDNHKKTFGQ